MKKLLCSMMAVTATAMILAGGNTIVFAAEESSLPETLAAASQPGTSLTEKDIHPISETERINEAPNTGIGMAPIVAAVLMAGSVPVIVKTSRKK